MTAIAHAYRARCLAHVDSICTACVFVIVLFGRVCHSGKLVTDFFRIMCRSATGPSNVGCPSRIHNQRLFLRLVSRVFGGACTFPSPRFSWKVQPGVYGLPRESRLLSPTLGSAAYSCRSVWRALVACLTEDDHAWPLVGRQCLLWSWPRWVSREPVFLYFFDSAELRLPGCEKDTTGVRAGTVNSSRGVRPPPFGRDSEHVDPLADASAPPPLDVTVASVLAPCFANLKVLDVDSVQRRTVGG